jgi:hypothetical protein
MLTTVMVRALRPGDFLTHNSTNLPNIGDGAFVETLYREDGNIILTTDRHFRLTVPERTLVEVHNW